MSGIANPYASSGNANCSIPADLHKLYRSITEVEHVFNSILDRIEEAPPKEFEARRNIELWLKSIVREADFSRDTKDRVSCILNRSLNLPQEFPF